MPPSPSGSLLAIQHGDPSTFVSPLSLDSAILSGPEPNGMNRITGPVEANLVGRFVEHDSLSQLTNFDRPGTVSFSGIARNDCDCVFHRAGVLQSRTVQIFSAVPLLIRGRKLWPLI